MTRVTSFLLTLALLLAAPAAFAVEGDFNGDGVVDDVDQEMLMDALNTSPGDDGYIEGADYDGDGAISLADVSIFLDIRQGR